MRLINLFALSLLTSTALFSSTTMCFKENHSSMATIESTPLDGGVCSSTKSLNDMKKDGWSVEDIKIEESKSGKNYIYILKKEETPTATLDEKALEQRIMDKLEQRKVEEAEAKKTEIKLTMSKSGREIYINKCQQCHGEKAEKEAYGTSRALNTLSLDDMQISIRDYTLDNYNRGKSFIMRPYAEILLQKDVKNVYSYIQTLKPETKKEEESK